MKLMIFLIKNLYSHNNNKIIKMKMELPQMIVIPIQTHKKQINLLIFSI